MADLPEEQPGVAPDQTWLTDTFGPKAFWSAGDTLTAGIGQGYVLVTPLQLTNVVSAIANDIGYDSIFEYQLQSLADSGDVLIAISSSGRSPNIVRALQWANDNGLRTIALTGFSGVPARELAGVSVHVGCDNYGIIEDAHQACMHLLAQYVRQSRMTSIEVAATTF